MVLDPSRVAAQIVTGVGFLGAGIIFVRRDSVRGLTTAAAIWVTAAVGACAGAGLPILRDDSDLSRGGAGLSPNHASAPEVVNGDLGAQIRYADGRGILGHLLEHTTSLGFVIDQVSTESVGHGSTQGTYGPGIPLTPLLRTRSHRPQLSQSRRPFVSTPRRSSDARPR